MFPLAFFGAVFLQLPFFNAYPSTFYYMTYQSPFKSTLNAYIDTRPADQFTVKHCANSIHTVKDFYPPSVANSKPYKVIHFEASTLPVILNFQTRSSKLMPVENYLYSQVKVEQSESIKMPPKVWHILINPIIQNACQRRSPAIGFTETSWKCFSYLPNGESSR